MDNGLLATIFRAIKVEMGHDDMGTFYGNAFMRFRVYPFRDAPARGLKSASVYLLSDIQLITAERLAGSEDAFNDLVDALRSSANGRTEVLPVK